MPGTLGLKPRTDPIYKPAAHSLALDRWAGTCQSDWAAAQHHVHNGIRALGDYRDLSTAVAQSLEGLPGDTISLEHRVGSTAEEPADLKIRLTRVARFTRCAI
jgi:hypothetical protein